MNKIQGLISIARKAGFVIIGKEKLATYTKKLYLLLIDKSAGNSLLREMKFLSENRDIPLLEIENLAELVSIENCKAIGLKNKALSKKKKKCVKGE